ncbi:MAG: PAS domain S-box protein, partial [bacterium]|nr:PAS domain S-box protein [bacterium]
MEIVTKTIKIMIVEDELIVSKHIRNHLEKAGYTVTAAVSTGEEAVVRAAENVPDLILMDIRLGGEMDGIEAAAKIRSRFNIPIIYLTAFTDSETLKRSRITEPFGYLLKPFEAKALHSTIEVALYKHRMEKKLKESEARFRTLAQSAPVGIFQTDAAGNCIYVNEKWCEMGGLSPAEAEGEGWRLALHTEDRERIFSQWYQMVASGEKFTLEYRFQTPGGKVTWVFGQVVPLVDDSGNKYGYMGTVSDLSERKKLEEQLLTGRKLESLGILAGGIAHDFNNLLSVILGNVCMVMEEIKPAELHYKMLSMVEKASSEAADLAQKLITFSKGGWLLKKEVPLDTLLNSVLAPTLTGTDCTWEADIAGDLLTVNGDEAQLGQVFSNLLSNAGEAGGNQAAPANKITLRAR